MDFLDIMSIAEEHMELINPSTPEKIIKIGTMSGLCEGTKVIEIGCGFGEVLKLWGINFGISGTGIEIREKACDRARTKLASHQLGEKIEIICGSVDALDFNQSDYQVAACIGASFVWDGFRNTIRHLDQHLTQEGVIIIGEPYLKVEKEMVHKEISSFHTEKELLDIIREEGYELTFLVRSSEDDWDRYQSDNWYGLSQWLAKHSTHPDHNQVYKFFHSMQNKYFDFERSQLGWALFSLRKIKNT